MAEQRSSVSAEVWRPVVGYEGLYEVSNLGRVRSLRGARPKVMKGYITKKGYHRILFCVRRKTRKRFAHHLVLEAFVGPCPDGQQARHLDDDKLRNELENLAWGTSVQNTADAIRNGVFPIGERAGSAKLTVEAVRAIRRADPKTQDTDLARLYGVTHTTIASARSGRSWVHVV